MSNKGSYALILRCDRSESILIGQLGQMRLQTGFYIYAGSAFGPGGVNARLRHHYQIAANPRWHLDYLRAGCEPMEHWFTHDPERREHDWAATLLTLPGFNAPMQGFGSSDCRCKTHLAFSAQQPDFGAFRDALFQRCSDHDAVFRATQGV